MATAFAFILLAITLGYAIVLSGFRRGLGRLRKNEVLTPGSWPSVSIVLPARNEAEVLERTLDSLLAQEYAGEWEIVVVDDRSTDATPSILRSLGLANDRIRVVTIQETQPHSPKKHALAKGVTASVGEIIVTTDADCVYDPSWVSTLVMHMGDKVGVVAGLTIFDLPIGNVPIWQRVQWLDFFVQNALAAGAVGAGIPGSCNGSNLAYRRQVYTEISGFGDSGRQVSGDDVLFAQRVSLLTDWQMVFAIDRRTTVRSLPVGTIHELIHQRMRWASKGLAYRGSMLCFLFGVYVYLLMIVASPVFMMLAPVTIPLVVSALVLRAISDYTTVRLAAKLFAQESLLPYFVPFSFAHTIFTPVFGIGGLLVPFQWKGDWYRTSRLPRSMRRSFLRIRRLVKQKRGHPVS